MKIVAIHLTTVWLVFQAMPSWVWGNCLRGPDTPHHVCEHEEHHHFRAVEKGGGGGGGPSAAKGAAAAAAAVKDDHAQYFPKANTMRTLEDKTFLYGPNADFDRGSLINLNHNAVQDQLQLDQDPQPLNFIKDLPRTVLQTTLPPTTPAPTTPMPTLTPSPKPTVTLPPGGKAELWVGHHQFQSQLDNFDQAKIWVISSNPVHHSSLPADTWKPVPKNMRGLDDYKGDRKLAKFYSIGAGEASTTNHNLKGEINRKEDVSKALHVPKFIMEIDDPAAFKVRVDAANLNMNANFSNTLLCYQVYPWIDWLTRGYGWVEFNSNGYISGLLSFFGQVIEKPRDYVYGWDKPVPRVLFEKKDFTNNSLKKEYFVPPVGGEAEIWVGYHSVQPGEENVLVDHAKLWVISSNPAHHMAMGDVWKPLSRDRIPSDYKGDKNFAKFFTLGAGFSAHELKAEVNHEDDVNKNLSGAKMVASSLGIDPVAFKTSIDTANKNMLDLL